jgi:DNA-directed RNA polymerase specialized sigma54-like protein
MRARYRWKDRCKAETFACKLVASWLSPSMLDNFFAIVLISPSMSNAKFEDAYYMLEISRAELQNVIRTQLQENPALESDEAAVAEISAPEKREKKFGSLRPDVRLEPRGRQFAVVLIDEGQRLRINPLYQRIASQKIRIEGRVDYPFFVEKARAAKWFIKAVEQRQSTIVKVTEGIFTFQSELLQHGLNHIKPMTLRDVSEEIRLPESIVTRAAANKWVETPQALFALDWFFAAPKANTAGR